MGFKYHPGKNAYCFSWSVKIGGDASGIGGQKTSLVHNRTIKYLF